jgi:hypothetical protein
MASASENVGDPPSAASSGFARPRPPVRRAEVVDEPRAVRRLEVRGASSVSGAVFSVLSAFSALGVEGSSVFGAAGCFAAAVFFAAAGEAAVRVDLRRPTGGRGRSEVSVSAVMTLPPDPAAAVTTPVVGVVVAVAAGAPAGREAARWRLLVGSWSCVTSSPEMEFSDVSWTISVS